MTSCINRNDVSHMRITSDSSSFSHDDNYKETNSGDLPPSFFLSAIRYFDETKSISNIKMPIKTLVRCFPEENNLRENELQPPKIATDETTQKNEMQRPPSTDEGCTQNVYDEGMNWPSEPLHFTVINSWCKTQSESEFYLRRSVVIGLHNLGLILQKKAKYQEALDLYQTGKNLERENIRLFRLKDNNIYLLLKLRIGQIHYHVGDLISAEQIFHSGLKSLKFINEFPELYIAYLNCVGVLLYHNDKDNMTHALITLTKALNAGRTLFGKTSLIPATILNNLGRMYDNEQEYSKSLECEFEFVTVVVS